MDGTGNAPLKAWLQGLYDANGHLTPEIVREAARPADSPGHLAIFGLSVGDAAEAYYLDRAHRLIQSVKIITIPQPNREPVTLRAYHAVPVSDDRTYVYRSVDDLVKQPDQLVLARNEAKRRLNDAERSLRSLDALVDEQARKHTGQALLNLRAAQEELDAA